MELEDETEFDNDFDKEELDRDILERTESAVFDLLLWEDFELRNSDFLSPTLLFRLHGFFGSENLVLSWTIIRTAITCYKIPCYMCDSACKWFIVKKAKIV